MNTRRFDDAGRDVSEVGLGCWQIGGSWGEIDDQTALDILAAAHDAGVSFFDTADVYGGGRSERLIGRFLKDRGIGDEVFVATKLGRKAPFDDPATFATDRVGKFCDDSLKNLGVESLDLAQLHCVGTDILRDGSVFDTLRDLKTKGKIKAFGASVESAEQAKICLQQDGLSSLQTIFNVFRQTPIESFFDEAKRKNVAIIVRLPLASGLLSGKLSKDTAFDQNDHRNFNRDGEKFNVGETFAGLPFERGVELADGIRPVLMQGQPESVTMAQAAQRWVLDHDAVTTVITGASRPEQARANAAVSDLPPLSPLVHSELADLWTRDVAPLVRGPD